MPNGQIDPRLTAPTPGLGEAVKKIFAPGKWRTEQQMAFLRTIPTYAAHTAQVMRRHIAEGKSPEEAAQAISTATGMIPEVATAQTGFFPSTTMELTELYSVLADLPAAEVQERFGQLEEVGFTRGMTMERMKELQERRWPVVAAKAEIAGLEAQTWIQKLAGERSKALYEQGIAGNEAALAGLQIELATGLTKQQAGYLNEYFDYVRAMEPGERTRWLEALWNPNYLRDIQFGEAQGLDAARIQASLQTGQEISPIDQFTFVRLTEQTIDNFRDEINETIQEGGRDYKDQLKFQLQRFDTFLDRYRAAADAIGLPRGADPRFRMEDPFIGRARLAVYEAPATLSVADRRSLEQAFEMIARGELDVRDFRETKFYRSLEAMPQIKEEVDRELLEAFRVREPEPTAEPTAAPGVPTPGPPGVVQYPGPTAREMLPGTQASVRAFTEFMSAVPASIRRYP